MNRLLRSMLLPAALAPAAVIAYLVHRYSVNVPFWDQWMLVDPLIEIELGSFPWSDVFGQHNEHRMAFPKLIMLALARLTGWNTLAEVWCSVVLAVASLVLLLSIARPAMEQAGPTARFWAAAMISAMVFSLTQWENWLWGWQVQWFLGVLAAVSVVALTTWSLGASRPWRYVAGAALAAIVCQYSVGSGLAIWVSGAMILAFHKDRRRLLAAWSAVAIGSSAIYFIGYVSPPNHPSMAAAFERPGDFLIYIGNYLAGPLAQHAAIGLEGSARRGYSPVGPLTWRVVIGYLVAAAFVLLAALSLPRLRREPQLAIPWIAIGAFAGANAVVTGIGRVGMGAEQGLHSRYVTIALLMSVSLVPLGLIVFRGWPGWKPARVLRATMLGGAALMTAFVILSDIRSLPSIVGESRKLREARACMLRIEEVSDECVSKLFPDPRQARHWHKQLVVLGWSGFPADARQPRGMIRIDEPGGARLWRLRPIEGPAGWLDGAVYDGGTLSVAGWASDPMEAKDDARRVIVTVGDAMRAEARFVGEAALSEPIGPVTSRRDLGLTMRRWVMRMPGLPMSGWPLRFRAYLVVGDDALTPIGGRATVGETLRLASGDTVRSWHAIPSTGRAGVLDGAEIKDGRLLVFGWATPLWGNAVAPRRVLIAAGDRLIGETETASDRPDVSAHFGDPRLRQSGWSLAVEIRSRERLVAPLRAFVVIGEGLLMPLEGSATLPPDRAS